MLLFLLSLKSRLAVRVIKSHGTDAGGVARAHKTGHALVVNPQPFVSRPPSLLHTKIYPTNKAKYPTKLHRPYRQCLCNWLLAPLHRNDDAHHHRMISQLVISGIFRNCGGGGGIQQEDPVGALGTLQLRLVLRALGVSTTGMKKVLTERLREAVSSGRVQAFVAEGRSTQPESFQCGELPMTSDHSKKSVFRWNG